MAMNQSCYGILGNENISKYFNYFNLKRAVDQLKQNTHGAVFDTITSSTFDTIKLPFGNIPLVQKFDIWVEPLLGGLLNNCKENLELTNLRNTLLPKLISGEIAVVQEETELEN